MSRRAKNRAVLLPHHAAADGSAILPLKQARNASGLYISATSHPRRRDCTIQAPFTPAIVSSTTLPSWGNCMQITWQPLIFWIKIARGAWRTIWSDTYSQCGERLQDEAPWHFWEMPRMPLDRLSTAQMIYKLWCDGGTRHRDARITQVLILFDR